MTERSSASWLVYVLGALCVGAIAAAVLVVGPASGSQATVTRTATVAEGVVQSTVSGSGNLQALSQLNLGFRTGGTVTHINVTQGEQVAEGQLIAELDPESAEVTLEQSKAALQSAEANLAKEEETDGETSSGSSGERRRERVRRVAAPARRRSACDQRAGTRRRRHRRARRRGAGNPHDDHTDLAGEHQPGRPGQELRADFELAEEHEHQQHGRNPRL